MNDKIGYTLVGTSTLFALSGWATVATVVALGALGYIVYEKLS